MTTPTTALNFPHPELPTIGSLTVVPTYSSLRAAQDHLNDNAMAIHSHGGGGRHGHLGLVLPADEYLAVAGVAYVPPVSPGVHPVHAVGSTGPMIVEQNRQHVADQATFRLHNQVELALTNML